MHSPESVDAYIANFPEKVQHHLKAIRSAIRKVVPKSDEKISYGIPTVTLDGKYLLYYAAHKNHIGVYPVPTTPEFARAFAQYKTSGKGTIQFPLDKPMPLKLIEKIVQYRLNERKSHQKPKGVRKTCGNGHVFYQSSDCPTCPDCETQRTSKTAFLASLSAPARRALENAGIRTLKQLSKWSEKEILSLHGMGPSSLPKLRKALGAQDLDFRK